MSALAGPVVNTVVIRAPAVTIPSASAFRMRRPREEASVDRRLELII
jgi:hypothetical protein